MTQGNVTWMEEETNAANTFGGLSFNFERNCVVDKNDQQIEIRPKSLAVFRYLSERHDTVVSRESLIDSVWDDVVVTEGSLSKCIADIRKRLGADSHKVLKTVPKRGYMLVSDPIITTQEPETERADKISTTYPGKSLPSLARSAMALLATLPFLAAIALQLAKDNTDTDQSATHVVVSTDEVGALDNSRPPLISLEVSTIDTLTKVNQEELRHEIASSLSRYKTLELVDHNETDYSLFAKSGSNDDGSYLLINLVENTSGREVFSDRIQTGASVVDTAVRVSAMIASPATGVIGRELLAKGRRKPVADLTSAECYAHGYDCTNCSGELDTVDLRAQECLTNALVTDNTDVRAWGLQSTVYAKQYQWSTNLGEPLRTNVKLRQPIVQKALAAANQAEQLSDGSDSSVYWGMAQAYLAACDTNLMQTAMTRGLAINPNDPGLLGTFGNWMAYSGNWDEGVAMVEEALKLEPRHFKRWWLFAPAKRHYIRGEYQQALELFQQAFNERNWLSHLQLSYTLPYLGRMKEAQTAVSRLQYVFPGVTIEVALQLYKNYCFPDDYLRKMKQGLKMAGLPERGDSSDFNNIQMPMAKIARFNDWVVEYMDLGEGLPVVFVHGAMSDYRTWAHYQNPVSEKYRYISYSRRYHGSQAWPDEGLKNTVQQHASDLEKFIESLAIENAVLVTWSSGSPISTLFALRRPDLVKGLVLYEPNTLNVDDESESDYPHAEKKRFLGNFKRIFEHLEVGETESATKAFLETVFENHPGEFETELMAIRRVVLDNVNSVPLRFMEGGEPDVKITCKDLAKLEVPALVLTGENTNEFWQYRARKYNECAPDSTIVSVPGVNHAGPIRVPHEIFSHIDRFISSRIKENR